MEVSQGMSPTVLTVGPSHSLREAAAAMTEKRVGAAVGDKDVTRTLGFDPLAVLRALLRR